MGKVIINNSSERLFAELCAKNYLKGFVFHSPRLGINNSEEVGDVVLWVRNQIIVFEIIWRNNSIASTESTKSFVKKIGKKRDQLLKDYNYFETRNDDIQLKNENGELVSFTSQNFHSDNFCGIVLVDCDNKLEELSYKTIEKSLESSFPIAFMTKNDFMFLVNEADTIPDLTYYLKDRFNFLKKIYSNSHSYFRNFNDSFEKEIIALYKMNEYSFPLDIWNASVDKKYWNIYQTDYAELIRKRNAENAESYIIDNIIDELRNINTNENSTILHTSELAIFPRRSRAQKIAAKINDAIERLKNGNELRYFSFYNETTECWLLFYFYLGGDSNSFIDNVTKYCRLKLFYEMNHNNFQYSVFGYGFRKSVIHTGNTFDQIFLCIEDAFKYHELNIEELKEANKLFGHISKGVIREFPE